MIKINLNKKSKKIKIKIEKKDIKSIAGYVIMPVIISAAAIYLMNFFVTVKINSVNKDIKIYNSRISALIPKVQMVDSVRKKQAEILQKINIIKRLKSEQGGPVGYIYYITRALPRFAWIHSLKSAGGNISVSGIALDGQVVSLFMDKLHKTGFFDNVTLFQTSEVKQNGLKLQNFSLAFKGRRGFIPAAKN